MFSCKSRPEPEAKLGSIFKTTAPILFKSTPNPKKGVNSENLKLVSKLSPVLNILVREEAFPASVYNSIVIGSPVLVKSFVR